MRNHQYGAHGRTGMVEVRRLDESTEEDDRLEKLEAESYFSQHSAILVLDLYPILDAQMKKYRQALKEYNQKLKAAGYPLRIRATQQVTTSNRKTYYYHGRYGYMRKETPSTLPPLQPEPEGFEYLSEEEYNALRPAEKTQYTKRKNAYEAHQRVKGKLKDKEEAEDLPQDGTVSRKDWVYMGKVEDLMNDPDYMPIFKHVGNPPFHPLEGLRAQRVRVQGKPSDHVIIPQNTLYEGNLNQLLNGLTHFKLRG